MIEILNNKIQLTKGDLIFVLFFYYLSTIFRKKIFFVNIYIFYFSSRQYLISKKIIVYFQNIYLFIVAFTFLFKTIIFFFKLIKGEFLLDLIKVSRLFHKRICIYFIKYKQISFQPLSSSDLRKMILILFIWQDHMVHINKFNYFKYFRIKNVRSKYIILMMLILL